MVRGFWGDIVQSPYIPFGVEIWKEPENTMFKKQINFQAVYVSHSTHISESLIVALLFSLPAILLNSIFNTISRSSKIKSSTISLSPE